MNYSQKLKISKEIELQLFRLDHEAAFFQSIHKLQSSDKYRVNLQCRFPKIENVLSMLKDAIENKFIEEGSPDYFIYYKGEVAGMFEFHPLTSADHVEIGYWLFSEYRRKGILSKVIPKMIEYSKDQFDKSIMLATTSIDNLPSQSLLERCEFKKSGRILEFPDKDTGEVSREYEYKISLI